MLPIGSTLRNTRLQYILLNKLKNNMKLKTLSLMSNFEEDISVGACHISHLLFSNQLCFDKSLINGSVFLPNDFKMNKESPYVITCSQDYLKAIKEQQWKWNIDSNKWNKMKTGRYFG